LNAVETADVSAMMDRPLSERGQPSTREAT
jgi:hypothetical protein